MLSCLSTVLDIWKMIITNAHTTAEPGVCYIDRVNEDNPTPALGTINVTNPCEEQPLLAKRLSGFIQDKAHKASQKLAQQRGCFPNWKGSI